MNNEMIKKILLDLFFPTKCVFCRKLISYKESVCSECMHNLSYTGVELIQRSIPNIRECISPFFYENKVRESLLRYKFAGCCGYASVYSEFMLKAIDEMHCSCDIITWIPISSRRQHKRGYNQAQLLAEELSRKLKVPAVETLIKIRQNVTQSTLHGVEERKNNVRGVYRSINDDVIQGRKVLIVDDIVTTGATLSECASLLTRSGAEVVFAVTVARHRDS